MNAAVFIIFAFSFAHPRTGRDWRSLPERGEWPLRSRIGMKAAPPAGGNRRQLNDHFPLYQKEEVSSSLLGFQLNSVSVGSTMVSRTARPRFTVVPYETPVAY
jgi:hypothetical protein